MLINFSCLIVELIRFERHRFFVSWFLCEIGESVGRDRCLVEGGRNNSDSSELLRLKVLTAH